MELKIMTWNIKGESSLVWNNQYEIKKEVVEKVFSEKSDVIVLTEFVIAQGVDLLFSKFQEKGYVWFQQSRTGKNGILIAIKRELIDDRKLVKQVYEEAVVSSEMEGCNILKVLFPMKNGSKLCVLGCRMETGGEKNLKEQYDSEKECFEKVLLPYINEIKSFGYCIVCGDFNNARCLGKLNEKFNCENYAGKAQINYNLNIIKDEFEKLGFIMADCNDGEAIPTHNNFFPDDHIFVKGFSVIRCNPINVGRLSDHDMLIADCCSG